jgi:hypothetical protein
MDVKTIYEHALDEFSAGRSLPEAVSSALREFVNFSNERLARNPVTGNGYHAGYNSLLLQDGRQVLIQKPEEELQMQDRDVIPVTGELAGNPPARSTSADFRAIQITH